MRADLDPGDIAAGAEVVLRSEATGDERRARFERFDDDPRSAQAFVDIYDLIPAGAPDDRWILHVSLRGGPPQQLAARKGVGGRESRVAGNPTGLYRMRANVNREGVPLVRCKRLPAHAEVERVEVDDDSIAITGTIAPRDGELKLVAQSRRDGTESTWPVDVYGRRIRRADRHRGPRARGRCGGMGPAARRRARTRCGSAGTSTGSSTSQR